MKSGHGRAIVQAMLAGFASARNIESAMLRLTTFGGLGLTHDGHPVADAVAQRRRLLVLAILASEYPTAISRTRLSALVWGTAASGDGDSARNNLRQAVFALRQGFATLGATLPPVIGTAELTLDPRAVTVDCIEFSAAIEQTDYRGAMRVYRGGFLEGVSLEQSPPALAEWVALRRERYASQFRSACVSLATEARSHGNWGESLEAWAALRAFAPDDEDAIRGTLTGLVRLGRTHEARHQALRYDARVGAAAPNAPGPAGPSGLATSFLATLLADVAQRALRPTAVEVSRAEPSSLSGTNTSKRVQDRQHATRARSHFGAFLARVSASTPARSTVLAITACLIVVVALLTRSGMYASGRRASGAPPSIVSAPAPAGAASVAAPIALPPITAGVTPALRTLSPVLRDAITRRLAANFPTAQLTGAAYVSAGTTVRLALDPVADSVRVTGIIENRTGTAARVANLATFTIRAAAAPGDVDSIARAVAVATVFVRQPPDAAEPVATLPRDLSAYADYVNARDSYLRTDYQAYAGRLLASYQRDSSAVLPAAMAAMALTDDGRCDSAARVLTRAREHARTMPERNLVDHVDFLNRGDYADAELAILRAYKAQPSPYYWLRGLSAASKLGDTARVDSLLAHAPTPWEASSVTVAVASESANRLAFATNYLRTLRARRPPGAILLVEAGTIFAAAGESDSALAIVDALRGSETRPDFPQGELIRQIAAELMARGHPAAAARAFRLAVEWYERQSSAAMSPAIRLQYAYALLDDGAVRRAETVLDETPDALLTRWQQEARHGVLGIAYARLHDRARAAQEDEWLRRQSNTCNFGIAFMWRARIAAAAGDADRAAELLSDAFGAGWPHWITAGPWEENHAMPEFAGIAQNPRFAAVLRGP